MSKTYLITGATSPLGLALMGRLLPTLAEGDLILAQGCGDLARLAGLCRGMTVTVRYFVPDLCCPADPPAGRYRTVTGAVQALDPIAKTLRLALEGQPKGPGLEKEKVVTIPFAEIETLQGSGE